MAYSHNIMDWDVLYAGSSIKSKVSSFEILASNDSYVREVRLNLADPSFQNNFDWTSFPSSPQLEVKVSKDGSWFTIGMFFLEKPTIDINIDGTFISGLWGRSQTAVLGKPFASTVNSVWSQNTTFQTICSDLLSGSGISISYEIEDMIIHAYTFVVEKETPIVALRRLCELAGCYLTTDGYSNLYVRKYKWDLTSSVKTFTDVDIENISTDVDYPDFGNRVKVAPTSGSSIEVTVSYLGNGNCLPDDDSVKGTYVAVVTDSEGNPVEDGVLVEWSVDESDKVNLDPASGNTGSFTIEETYTASSWREVEVDFPIGTVDGVWAAGDTSRTNNFYTERNGSFEDNTISFSGYLDYCDQKLVVKYQVQGAVQTRVSSNYTGTYQITAASGGASDSESLYIDNPCECGSEIYMQRTPSEDICYSSPVYILVVVEMLGRSGSGTVNFTHEGCGDITNNSKTLGTVQVGNERQTVKNVVEGVSQVETNYFILISKGVTVHLLDSEGNKTGGTAPVSSVSGKLIDLSSSYEDGTEFKVDYTAKGAATVMWTYGSPPKKIDATSNCKSTVKASIEDGTQEGLTESISFRVKECRVPEDEPTGEEEEEDEDVTYDLFDNDSAGTGEEGEESIGLTRCCQAGEFGTYAWTTTENCHDCSVHTTWEECEANRHNGCTWSKLYEDHYRCWCPESPVGSIGATPCSQGDLMNNRNVALEYGSGGVSSGDVDKFRFGVLDSENCDNVRCTCEEICEAELSNYGRLQTENESIHQSLISAGFEEGTPAYQTQYETERQARYNECVNNCENVREQVCGGDLVLTGPGALSQGETGLYSDNFGNEGTITIETLGPHSCPDSLNHILTSVDGYLCEMGGSAGGTFRVTVTYILGGVEYTDYVDTKCPDSGGWMFYSGCNCSDTLDSWTTCCRCIPDSGAFRYTESWSNEWDGGLTGCDAWCADSDNPSFPCSDSEKCANLCTPQCCVQSGCVSDEYKLCCVKNQSTDIWGC